MKRLFDASTGDAIDTRGAEDLTNEVLPIYRQVPK
jgi:hypothetical protein